MKIRHVRYWEQLRESYWFIPGLTALAALAFAVAITYVDWLVQHGRLPVLGHIHIIVSDAYGARIVLSTIAGSAITVAGVIFSITIVVLNTASTQFGPRILRNFMEHAGTQTVLGIYVGTFIYCLMVLSAMRTEGQQVFVPQHAIAAGILFGILSFAALIYFIHHVSVFIQAPRIIDNVAGKLEQTLRADYPEYAPNTLERPPVDADEAASDATEFDIGASRAICAPHSGYVQAIDYDGLLALSVRHDLVLRLSCRAGRFVFAERPLAQVAPARRLDEETQAGIVAAFIIGPNRTATQDLEFSVRQLVEIAVRALSPGINDPLTAITCIDRLGAALALLGRRALRSHHLRDQHGRVRVLTDPYTYPGVVGAAFNQIRQHARGNVAVSLRLLTIIAAVSAGELPRSFRDALHAQAKAICELNRDCLYSERDRDDFESHYQEALDALGRGGGPHSAQRR